MLIKKIGSLLAPSSIDQSHSKNNVVKKEGDESQVDSENIAEDESSYHALILHKRPDQSGHELIQQLLNASSDIGIFSAMGSDSMEKVIKKQHQRLHLVELQNMCAYQ